MLQVLGTFILWLGWYGFNPGSTLGIASPGSAQTAARCVVNTTLSAATCGLTVVVLDKLFGSRTWDVSAVCNGILGGLVSITAGCSTVYPWAAVLIGFIGGFVYFGSSKLVLNVLKVDDPPNPNPITITLTLTLTLTLAVTLTLALALALPLTRCSSTRAC